MNLQLSTLDALGTQTYNPRSFSPAPDPFTEYRRKEFSGHDLGELFHEYTKHTDVDSPRLRIATELFVDDDSLVFATANVDPDYPGHERIALPDPDSLDLSLETALATRRSTRSFTGTPLSMAQLATLFGHSLGVTADQPVFDPGDGGDLTHSLRAYPSAGGLYPVEYYVLLPRGSRDGDLDPGLYYYAPEKHALRSLERADEQLTEQVEALCPLADAVTIENAAAIVFMTGSFWRSKAKYGTRGYRFVLLEAGHAGQNLSLVAEALGLGALPFDGVDDRAVDEFLGVNGVDESLVYSVVVGHSSEDTDG